MKYALRSKNKLPSKLLSLPAELRNKIYKCCLIADDIDDTEIPTILRKGVCSVLITKDLKLPALLAVCRQIRMEATDIFYRSNKFHVPIHDWDASLYLAWRSHHSSNERKTLFYRVSGNPNWKNLEDWCRAVWSGVSPITTCDQSDGRKFQIVDAAHRIAVGARGKSWANLERQLNGMRMVLGQLDRRWSD